MPAKDNVVIRMSAEDAGAFEMWRQQAKGPEKMGDAIEKAAAKGKKASEDMGSTLTGLVGKWGGVAIAIGAATKAMNDYFDNKRKLEQEQAGSSAAADSAVRNYFRTAKISDPKEQAASLQRIGNVALRQKEKLSVAGSTANLLAEFGVSREQAEGDSLNEMLDMNDALGGSGADPAAIQRKVLEILKRSGAGISPKSIRSMGVTARSLIGKGGFNEEIMGEYSDIATAATAGGMDQGTGLSLYDALREDYKTKEAKTYFKNFAKPGMQKGEAAYRARAAKLLGAGGEADYKMAGDISDQSVAALQDESQTAGILGGMGDKKLDHEQIRARVKYLLRQQGASGEQQDRGMAYYDDPLGWNKWSDDEERAGQAFAAGLPGSGLSAGQEAGDNRRRAGLVEQAVGRAPIEHVIKVQIQGPDGLDIPHEPFAAALGDQPR